MGPSSGMKVLRFENRDEADGADVELLLVAHQPGGGAPSTPATLARLRLHSFFLQRSAYFKRRLNSSAQGQQSPPPALLGPTMAGVLPHAHACRRPCVKELVEYVEHDEIDAARLALQCFYCEPEHVLRGVPRLLLLRTLQVAHRFELRGCVRACRHALCEHRLGRWCMPSIRLLFGSDSGALHPADGNAVDDMRWEVVHQLLDDFRSGCGGPVVEGGDKWADFLMLPYATVAMWAETYCRRGAPSGRGAAAAAAALGPEAAARLLSAWLRHNRQGCSNKQARQVGALRQRLRVLPPPPRRDPMCRCLVDLSPAGQRRPVPDVCVECRRWACKRQQAPMVAMATCLVVIVLTLIMAFVVAG